MLHVYIGFDHRENIAAQVCAYSIVRRASEPVAIHMLEHKALRQNYGFNRTWRCDEAGQWWDDRDGKPFSTEFSHSRFLAPLIHKQHDRTGFGLFLDCDFLVLDDINKLFQLATYSREAILCVQDFPYQNKGVKMDSVIQEPYFRKLWSSLFMFNPYHADFKLTAHEVNYASGSDLHSLRWGEAHGLGGLGKLDTMWNYIPNSTDLLNKKPSAVHYSLGGPWMAGYEGVEYADEWREELKHMRDSREITEIYSIPAC